MATKTTSSAASAAVLLLVATALVAAVQLHPAAAARVHAEGGITCGAVQGDLMPCLGFLQSDGSGSPSGECCDGVKALYAAADTRANRQATCECLKAAYNQFSADLGAARALPGDCGLPLSYDISPDVDCTKIE